MNSIKKAVTARPDLILPPYDEFYKLLGYDLMAKLFEHYQGTTWYIPRAASAYRDCMRAAVEIEYNGHNVRAMAVKYGLSESTVRVYVRDLRGRT